MDILSRVNWVDVLVVIIMFRITYVAFQDGLSHEIFPLVAAFCTIVLSLQYYDTLATFLVKSVAGMSIAVTSFLSFTVLIVGFSLIFKTIRLLLDRIIKVSWHPVIEKFGGLIAGFMRASIVASTILIILALVPLTYLTTSIKERSMTGIYFLKIGPVIYEKVAKVIPGVTGFSEDSDEIVQRLMADKPTPKKEETKKKSKLASDWDTKFQ